MTREEFVNDITTFDELYDFCYERDIEFLFDDYKNEANDEASDWIEECISDRDGGWLDLRDTLNELYNNWEGVAWYFVGNGELEVCDEDYFEDLKRDVLTHCDEHGIFDEDDNDEDSDEEEEVEEVTSTIEYPVDGISVSTFKDVENKAVTSLYYVGGAKSESVKIL